MYNFIINPSSRGKKGLKLWQSIEKYLIEKSIDYSYYFTNPNISTAKLLDKIFITNDDEKKIIILGGDGTLNEVINGLSDDELESSCIGYIPTGSSNDFARSMNISKDNLTNLKAILSSKDCLELDLGKLIVNNKEFKFAVSSGSGYDAIVCKMANESRFKTLLNYIGLGRFAYLQKAVTGVFKTPLINATITIDNKEVRTYNHLLYIISMNQSYEGGGFKFAPQASPTDGLLSVSLMHNMSIIKSIVSLLHVPFGKHDGLKSAEIFNCKSIKVKLDKPWILHMDGEYPGTSDSFEVVCLPKKLKFIV